MEEQISCWSVCMEEVDCGQAPWCQPPKVIAHMPKNPFIYSTNIYEGPLHFPWWLSSKDSAYKAGDVGSIPGLGRSPGEGNGYPLQYSSLENSTDRGAWQATVHGVVKS